MNRSRICLSESVSKPFLDCRKGYRGFPGNTQGFLHVPEHASCPEFISCKKQRSVRRHLSCHSSAAGFPLPVRVLSDDETAASPASRQQEIRFCQLLRVEIGNRAQADMQPFRPEIHCNLSGEKGCLSFVAIIQDSGFHLICSNKIPLQPPPGCWAGRGCR